MGAYDEVHALVMYIPAGRVMTYGQLANKLSGCTARLVGYALAGLPQDSDVPWHRIVGAQGQIKKRKNDGQLLQRMMLEAEGVRFDNKGRIDLAVYGYQPDNLGE